MSKENRDVEAKKALAEMKAKYAWRRGEGAPFLQGFREGWDASGGQGKAQIAEGLAMEHHRVEEWCTRSADERHAAYTAIRCVATRLEVYPEFCAATEKDNL